MKLFLLHRLIHGLCGMHAVLGLNSLSSAPCDGAEEMCCWACQQMQIHISSVVLIKPVIVFGAPYV